MTPNTPDSVRGTGLNPTQRARLHTIISGVSSVNPGRTASSNLAHAVNSFLLTVSKVRGRFVDVQHFRLSDGNGPVVVPSWAIA
jgi:hypothetical protein